ncbi:hypothetical protein F5144DRAFT_258140 [Chaetomium tenue]|uniref:Uncharacterized protein n=1 Tax=Chaetomium tenue TaxID=1854479 RepID=A0ACB7P8W9_9PEZI|nr:hypothetical protein F5144DRAFT_258140 [Chaetomium globosum]
MPTKVWRILFSTGWPAPPIRMAASGVVYWAAQFRDRRGQGIPFQPSIDRGVEEEEIKRKRHRCVECRKKSETQNCVSVCRVEKLKWSKGERVCVRESLQVEKKERQCTGYPCKCHVSSRITRCFPSFPRENRFRILRGKVMMVKKNQGPTFSVPFPIPDSRFPLPASRSRREGYSKRGRPEPRNKKKTKKRQEGKEKSSAVSLAESTHRPPSPGLIVKESIHTHV